MSGVRISFSLDIRHDNDSSVLSCIVGDGLSSTTGIQRSRLNCKYYESDDTRQLSVLSRVRGVSAFR